MDREIPMTNNSEYKLRKILGLEDEPLETKSESDICKILLRYCTVQELTVAIKMMQQEPGNPAYIAFLRDMRSRMGSQKNGNHQRETT